MADLTNIMQGGGVDLFGLTPGQINDIVGRRRQTDELAKQIIGTILQQRSQAATRKLSQEKFAETKRATGVTESRLERALTETISAGDTAEKREGRLTEADLRQQKLDAEREAILRGIGGTIDIGGEPFPVGEALEAFGPSIISATRPPAPSAQPRIEAKDLRDAEVQIGIHSQNEAVMPLIEFVNRDTKGNFMYYWRPRGFFKGRGAEGATRVNLKDIDSNLTPNTVRAYAKEEGITPAEAIKQLIEDMEK